MTGRPPERDELDALLDHLLQFAGQLLGKYGEFYPFADSLHSDGEIAMVASWDGNDRPDSREVIEVLVQGLRQDALLGKINAAGICSDVRMTKPDGTTSDAVRADLEHRAGDAVSVFMPYSKNDDDTLVFGELAATPYERRIFGG